MKKFAILAVCFVLAIGLMTACGGSSSDETAGPSSSSTTTPTTVPTTAATVPSTAPSSAATTPSDSGMLEDGMIDGNGDAAGKSGRVNRMD